MYDKIYISSTGKFHFVNSKIDYYDYPFEFDKSDYEFLMDVYNSDLENTRMKCARESFEQSYDDREVSKYFNQDVIHFDQAYEEIKEFIKLSEDDLTFVKNLLLLLTDDKFKSKDVIDILHKNYSKIIRYPDWDFIEADLKEISRRITLITSMKAARVPYEQCFNDKISNALYTLEKYDMMKSLRFDAHIQPWAGIGLKLFGYVFDSMRDVIMFELYNLILNDDTIKQCRNCGKIFAPLRSDALYCDNISPQDEEKTCKEYGSYKQWIKNIESDESTKLYRKIYMRKQMQAKRHPEEKKYMTEFEEYKSMVKVWRNDVKRSRRSNKEFLEWLKNLDK